MPVLSFIFTLILGLTAFSYKAPVKPVLHPEKPLYQCYYSDNMRVSGLGHSEKDAENEFLKACRPRYGYLCNQPSFVTCLKHGVEVWDTVCDHKNYAGISASAESTESPDESIKEALKKATAECKSAHPYGQCSDADFECDTFWGKKGQYTWEYGEGRN